MAGRHPSYRGIRCRNGRWVSEIRKPRDTTRIWLGTYATADMAAVAYDVAALALKGPDAIINFPGLTPTYPVPASFSTEDIRAAASSAAAALPPRNDVGSGGESGAAPPPVGESSSSNAEAHGFVDEEELFGMPKLMDDMAEGMLLSPPRLKAAEEDESPENCSNYDSLWNYR